MLLQKINENHKDKYDFFYLPIDVKVIIFLLSLNFCYRTNAMLDMLLLILLTQSLFLNFLKNLMVRDGNASIVKKYVNWPMVEYRANHT